MHELQNYTIYSYRNQGNLMGGLVKFLHFASKTKLLYIQITVPISEAQPDIKPEIKVGTKEFDDLDLDIQDIVNRVILQRFLGKPFSVVELTETEVPETNNAIFLRSIRGKLLFNTIQRYESSYDFLSHELKEYLSPSNPELVRLWEALNGARQAYFFEDAPLQPIGDAFKGLIAHLGSFEQQLLNLTTINIPNDPTDPWDYQSSSLFLQNLMMLTDLERTQLADRISKLELPESEIVSKGIEELNARG